ncbi:MAG: response regulator transcription factor [Rickettsiales bacterium]
MPRYQLLVIEDEADIAELICHAAGEMGMDTRHACNFDALTEILAAFTPDIILLDIMMPEKDGFEVLRFLHEQRHPARILVISGDAHYRPMAFRMGEGLAVEVVGVLAKPFRLSELRLALAEIVAMLDEPDTGTQGVA